MLGAEQLSPQDILDNYKEQIGIERGFRFIKDPNIVAASFFVQKPERINALLFIMTLCLLIYAILERKIRTILTTVALFFKNQLGKDTQKPTANWIFQSFVGIHVLQINEKNKLILNLKQAQKELLLQLGDTYGKYYQDTQAP